MAIWGSCGERADVGRRHGRRPGELIHMNKNGAAEFPADKAEQVLDNARKMLECEAEHLARLRAPTTATGVRAAGGFYAAKHSD
jgi:4-hydroxy-4-methyl-2-oxoglutarate aldolase